MACYASDAARCRDLARDLERHENVLSATAVEPDAGLRDEWSVEATLADTDGLPTDILRTIVQHGADLHQQPPQARAERILASLP